jgi:hypothetical protein
MLGSGGEIGALVGWIKGEVEDAVLADSKSRQKRS